MGACETVSPTLPAPTLSSAGSAQGAQRGSGLATSVLSTPGGVGIWQSMNARKRFWILARDKHTCQYCGAGPTTVPLHVDHIKPKSAGGTDDPWNLITSCRLCNQGKHDRRLDLVDEAHTRLRTILTEVMDSAFSEGCDYGKYLAKSEIRERLRIERRG